MLTCHIIIITQDRINQLEENERRFEGLMPMNIEEYGFLRYDYIYIEFDGLGTEVSEEPKAIN